ncbi:MAG: uroporphyrinogen-III C-methyltransferase [Chloroflexota bacterium]|nr:uroporphyrinogen-III C-methyltransferase [Chloroflexota bacterium]
MPELLPTAGLVSLVGAGPGDPDLLTIKALKRLERADAVVFDRLIARALLDYAPRGATMYDVGKIPGLHGASRQTEINDLLIRLGREGLRVVRLKGGDPFLFGRGGEEALALTTADVPWEIIPGISSALAAPAAAGMPVTHRGYSGSVTIATGHAQTGEHADAGHDWGALARMRGTLVFLMAVENLDLIVQRLLAEGRDGNEPAALVRWGTTTQQTVLSSTLSEIAARARAVQLQPPAVLVIGPTVRLAHVLTLAGTVPAYSVNDHSVRPDLAAVGNA